MKNLSLVFVLLFVVSGCASRLKKECNAKNWYQHGYDIAMQGKRTSGDSYIQQCEKEKADIKYADIDLGFKAGMQKYCNPKTSFEMGRDGKRLGTEDFCTPGMTRKMTKAHSKGLAIFCTAENGKKVGSSGRVYDKVCPSDLEPKFLSTYKPGRKKYLKGLLVVTNSKLSNTRSQLNRQERALRAAQRSLSRFRPVYNTKRVKKKDSKGNEYWETEKDETFESRRMRNRLTSEVDRQERLVRESNQKVQELQRVANDTQLELTTQF